MLLPKIKVNARFLSYSNILGKRIFKSDSTGVEKVTHHTETNKGKLQYSLNRDDVWPWKVGSSVRAVSERSLEVWLGDLNPVFNKAGFGYFCN